MLSNRPYLLRAFHEWIIDSACTPILVLDATHPRCKIPRDFVEGGEIVFNISPAAIRDLKMTNELVEFKASFSGVIHIVSAPISAVLAIYAEENGEGLFFDADEEGTSDGGMRLKTVESPALSATSLPPLSHEAGVKEAAIKSKPFLTLVE